MESFAPLVTVRDAVDMMSLDKDTTDSFIKKRHRNLMQVNCLKSAWKRVNWT